MQKEIYNVNEEESGLIVCAILVHGSTERNVLVSLICEEESAKCK